LLATKPNSNLVSAMMTPSSRRSARRGCRWRASVRAAAPPDPRQPASTRARTVRFRHGRSALGGGREDGLGQLVAFRRPAGRWMPHTVPVAGTLSSPSRRDSRAPRTRSHHAGALDQHGAAFKLIAESRKRVRIVRDSRGEKVVGSEVAQEIEPEDGKLVSTLPLSGMPVPRM